MPHKSSEHGLGHLRNPIDADDAGSYDPASTGRGWVERVWEYRASQVHGLTSERSPWLDRTAIGSYTVSSPHLRRCFRHWNAGQSYAAQVKPFAFMLVAFVEDSKTWGTGRLVAPFEPDASKWADLQWRNLDDPNGPTHRIVSDPQQLAERDPRIGHDHQFPTLSPFE